MTYPITLSFHDLPHSSALEHRARERAAKLGEFFGPILACDVVVETVQKHTHQGKLYNLRINLSVPKGEIVVNRHAREDPFVALRDAFDAARRQLEDHARRLKGAVKQHAEPHHGWVARVFPEDGFGFIGTASGQEFYFTPENLVQGDFDRLEPGVEVHFIQEMGAEGPQAKRIGVIEPHVHV